MCVYETSITDLIVSSSSRYLLLQKNNSKFWGKLIQKAEIYGNKRDQVTKTGGRDGSY